MRCVIRKTSAFWLQKFLNAKIIIDQEKINDHIQNCMTNHVDLFDRQDIVSRNWLGIEVVDSMQLERVLPAGYEVVAAELKIIQNIPI